MGQASAEDLNYTHHQKVKEGLLELERLMLGQHKIIIEFTMVLNIMNISLRVGSEKTFIMLFHLIG